MSDADSRGPQVIPSENLYRALVVPEWWDLIADPPCVSSFAFRVHSPFSVNVASKIGLEGAVRHMEEVLHCADGGIVLFNSGEARAIRFDARHEPDPQYPDNKAHANVYYDGLRNRRKRDAKALAEKCLTVRRPQF